MVAGAPGTKGNLPVRRSGLSVSGSLSIISGGQPGGFEEISSVGGTAADKTCGFVFAAASGSGKRAASPHPAALVQISLTQITSHQTQGPFCLHRTVLEAVKTLPDLSLKCFSFLYHTVLNVDIKVRLSELLVKIERSD